MFELNEKKGAVSQSSTMTFGPAPFSMYEGEAWLLETTIRRIALVKMSSINLRREYPFLTCELLNRFNVLSKFKRA